MPGVDICGQDAAHNIAQVWHIVHVGQGRSDHNVPHPLHRQDGTVAARTNRLGRNYFGPGLLGRGQFLRAHWALFGLAGFATIC